MRRFGHLLEREAHVQRLVSFAFFEVLPVTAVLLVIVASIGQGLFALDFHHAFWPAARSVLDGNFAYDLHFHGEDPFVYPPLTAVLLAPFGVFPVWMADGLYTAVGIVAVIFALRAFGVDDRRCYGAAFLWPPVLAAIQAGNLTLPLLGGIGLMWALRGRPFALGLTAALVISGKLFLAPIALWLLLTRRFRAAAWAGCLFVVMNALAWLAIGAGRLSTYLDFVARHTRGEEWGTYTLKVLASRLGLSPTFGMAVTMLAVSSLALAWWKWWRGDDGATLAVAVLVAIVASPIVWLHYLALLVAPVALMRRSLTWIWFLPLASVVCPGKGNGTLAQTALGVGLVATVAIATLWRPRAWRVAVDESYAFGTRAAEAAR